MSNNKTYICQNCKTIYDELPDNRDGQFHCGNCLSTDCFEERKSPYSELIMLKIIYQLLKILKMLHILQNQLNTITKQLKQIQSVLITHQKKEDKPE